MLTEPPSIDDGEITDKGYINKGAVLKRRQRRRPAARGHRDQDVIVVFS